MTTEQAIKLLHRLQDEQFDGIHGDERREALEMAVRALEQNLVQESGNLVQDLVKDCISRQAAIVTAVRAAIDWHRLANPQYSIAYCIGEAMRQLPSAQPQRKKGKWISNGVEAFGVVEYWVCNQCYDQSKYRTNFCPSCGADMRGESK